MDADSTGQERERYLRLKRSLASRRIRSGPAIHFTIPSGSISSTPSSFATALIDEVNPDLLNNA